MTKNEKPPIDLGTEFAKNIYSNAKFIANDVQPYFVLHKDTVCSFLHEKRDVLSSEGKLLGLLGIEASLIAALLTATFNDWHGIKGDTIEASFFISTLVFGYFVVREFIVWVSSVRTRSIDALTTELGKRGAVIEVPKQVSQPSN